VSVEQVWERYAERQRRWLRARVASDADADDLLSEVFLRVLQKLDQLEDAERLGAWVGRITRNVLIDHHRRRAPRTNVEGLDPACAADAPDPTPLAEWLAAEVAELEPPYREALELTELGGLSQKAAAERLGLSHSGVKSRVQRGRAQLAARLHACCQVALDARGGVLDVERRPTRAANDCERC
jgi:RNA polymerase sigma-70 factor (ECF subfamily)